MQTSKCLTDVSTLCDRVKRNKESRSNRHGRKRPYMAKYDDLHVIVLRPYISVSFTSVYGIHIRRSGKLHYHTRTSVFQETDDVYPNERY